MDTYLIKAFKNGLFGLLLSFVCFSQAYAQTGTVTLEAQNITLNELLTEIRKQTSYDFVFTSTKLDFNKKVSPKFKKANIVEVLNQYFNVNTGVIYIFKNKTIVLIDEEKADYKIVQGTVINSETKQPVAGASVGISEKKISTRTDHHGNRLCDFVTSMGLFRFKWPFRTLKRVEYKKACA